MDLSQVKDNMHRMMRSSYAPYSTEDKRRVNGAVPVIKVKSIQERHREIIRLAQLGFKNVEIADQLGITNVSVSQVLNSPVVVAYRDEMNRTADERVVDAKEQMIELLPEVVDIYKKLLTEDSDITNMERFRVAGDVLDRAGIAKESKVTAKSTSLHMTSDDLESLRSKIDKDAISIPSISMSVEEGEDSI